MSTTEEQMEKKAINAAPIAKTLAKYLASSVGTAAAWDALEQAPKEHKQATDWIPFVKAVREGDKGQIISDILSGTSGLLAGHAWNKKLPRGAGNAALEAASRRTKDIINYTTLYPLAKGVGFNALDYFGSGANANRANKELVEKQIEAFGAPSTTESPAGDKLNWILGGLGVGALGLGGLAVAKYLSNKKEKPVSTVKYRLQGKKGDPWSEAIVDMPIRTPRLSPKTKEGLEAGIRRQVNKNVKYLGLKRDPMTGKMLTYDEWDDMYGEGMDSSAHVPNEGYTAELDAKYEKTASTREWAEGAGSMLQWLLGSAAGAYLGDKFIGDNGPLPGKFLGAAVGGIAPGVIGRAFGSIAGKYDTKEQMEHDADHSIAEFVVPGYAEYHSARRNPLVNLPAPAIEDETDEYDDFDKEAAQAPQPPAPQQSTPGSLQKAPVKNPSTPIADGDAAKQIPTNPGATAAMNAINSIRSVFGIQPAAQEQQKQA